MNIIRHGGFFLTLTVFLLINRDVFAQTDSVKLVRYQLESIIDETSMIALRIKSYHDKRQYNSDLQVIQDKVGRIKASFPQLFDYPELVDLYRQYLDIVNGIDVNLEKVDCLHKIDSLKTIIDCWISRFDSLLAVGEDYADNKNGDSVRLIKLKADDWAGQIDAVKQMNNEFVNRDEELQQRFYRLSQTHDEIKELSERERIKLKDILKYGGITIGASVFAGFFLSNQLKSRKMMKNAEKAMKEVEERQNNNV